MKVVIKEFTPMTMKEFIAENDLKLRVIALDKNHRAKGKKYCASFDGLNNVYGYGDDPDEAISDFVDEINGDEYIIGRDDVNEHIRPLITSVDGLVIGRDYDLTEFDPSSLAKISEDYDCTLIIAESSKKVRREIGYKYKCFFDRIGILTCGLGNTKSEAITNFAIAISETVLRIPFYVAPRALEYKEVRPIIQNPHESILRD